MPFYDYSCCECGFTEELLVNMSKHDEHKKHKDLPSCTDCKDGFMTPSGVNKGTSFQLNGGGWAADGYQ